MRRRVLAVLGLLLATQALADDPHFLQDIMAPQDPSQFIARENALRREINGNFMLGDGGNPSLPSARLNLGIGHPVSLIDHGAQHDAKTYADGTITSGTPNLFSALASFTVQDEKKIIQIDGAGTGGVTGAPFTTTILTFVDAHHVILAANAPTSTKQFYYAAGPVVTTGTAGSYIPGELVPILGGTSSVQAVAKVQDTLVRTIAINAAGTNGVDGACVLQGTTGTGTPFRIAATITGGAITALGAFVGGLEGATGHYFTNPTSLAAEPPTNAPGYNCSPTDATLTLTMGAEIVSVQTAGAYTVMPPATASTGPGATSGATGLTVSTGEWGATGGFVYGTDDTPALTAAINTAAFDYSVGIQAYVFAPAGMYLINGAATPTMGSGLGVIGEGSTKTIFILGADYTGDLFSWSEAWFGGTANATPTNGSMQDPTNNKAGPKAIGFSVTGNRRSTGQQNALVYYDHNDWIDVRDIDITYINGRCIYAGIRKNKTTSYIRESHFNRVLCYNAGQVGVPAMEFTSEGAGGDGTNEVTLRDFDIYAPYDKALWLRNSVRTTKVYNLRIEGLQWNAANTAADFITLGDPVQTGQVHDIYFDRVLLTDLYTGQYGITTTAPAGSGLGPYFITFERLTFSGGISLGGGINLVAGRAMYFHISGMGTFNTNITEAAAPDVSPFIVVDGDGFEDTWTYNTSFARALATPIRRIGQPGQNAYLTTTQPDATSLGGGDRGLGAVDLQSSRISAAQVANGLQSVIGGGAQNQNNGLQGVIGGGFSNRLSGFQTAIPGGVRGTDYGLAGGLFYGSNCAHFNLQGSCQAGILTLSADTTSVTPTQMTSDKLAASSTNCLNIPVSNSWNIKLQIVARDHGAGGNLASWRGISGLLYREAGNATYIGQATGATAPDDSLGGGSGARVQLSADTVNQCLNVSWTAPNTDGWDVTARVDMVAVQ